MSNIVKYDWDLDRGVSSAISRPTSLFRPGIYDISVDLTMVDGSIRTVTELGLIFVAESDHNFFSGNNDNLVSYHFGFNNDFASGWSENSGENWIWPESSSAISSRIIDGESYLTVWDMNDDKQYWINTNNKRGHSISYKDKGLFDIECSATTRELVAASRAYIIKHLESIIYFGKDIEATALEDGLNVSVGLISTSENSPIETIERVEDGIDFTFKESVLRRDGESNIQQLKISVNKSSFLITEIESLFSSINKSRAAGVDVSVLESDTEYILATNVINWVTTPNYEFDLGTSKAIAPYGVNTENGNGGLPETTISYNMTSDLQLENPAFTGTLMLMYDNRLDRPGLFGALDFTDFGDPIENSQLAYCIGDITENISIIATGENCIVFDIRTIGTSLSTSDLENYLANVQRFIPGV